MNFSYYQKKSRETAIYPDISNNFVYPTLGLVGEAGEIANKIKKVLRDKNGCINEDTKTTIKEELGDVLWYVSQLATELELNLESVAQHNIEKLLSRKVRNTLQGSGDNR